MEMIMSIVISTPVPAEGMARQSRGSGSGLVAIVKRWWMAHLTRRIEQAAIVQLGSMSDRELKDIGLTRSQILPAVRGSPRDRLFNPYD
jgi:uncharacterized protein YjiS (DUF1127 family)